MSRAVDKLEARKNIQPATTKWKVAKPHRKRAPGVSVNFGLPWNACQPRCAAKPMPCQAPQTTKVQLAPCHKPPITMVITRFRYAKIFQPDRRPGSEK